MSSFVKPATSSGLFCMTTMNVTTSSALGSHLGKLCGEAVFAVLHELRLTSLNGLLRVGLDSRFFSDIAARELHRAVREISDVAVCKAASRGKAMGTPVRTSAERKEQTDPFFFIAVALPFSVLHQRHTAR